MQCGGEDTVGGPLEGEGGEARSDLFSFLKFISAFSPISKNGQFDGPVIPPKSPRDDSGSKIEELRQETLDSGSNGISGACLAVDRFL